MKRTLHAKRQGGIPNSHHQTCSPTTSHCQRKAQAPLIVLLATNGHVVLAHDCVSLPTHRCRPVSENYSKEKHELVTALGENVLKTQKRTSNGKNRKPWSRRRKHTRSAGDLRGVPDGDSLTRPRDRSGGSGPVTPWPHDGGALTYFVVLVLSEHLGPRHGRGRRTFLELKR